MDEWKKKSSSNSIRFFSSSSSTFDNRWSMFWKIISFSSLFFLSLPFFDDAWHIFLLLLLLLLSMIDEKNGIRFCVFLRPKKHVFNDYDDCRIFDNILIKFCCECEILICMNEIQTIMVCVTHMSFKYEIKNLWNFFRKFHLELIFLLVIDFEKKIVYMMVIDWLIDWISYPITSISLGHTTCICRCFCW